MTLSKLGSMHHALRKAGYSWHVRVHDIHGNHHRLNYAWNNHHHLTNRAKPNLSLHLSLICLTPCTSLKRSSCTLVQKLAAPARLPYHAVLHGPFLLPVFASDWLNLPHYIKNPEIKNRMDHAIGEMHAVGGVHLRWDACATCRIWRYAHCFHRTASIAYQARVFRPWITSHGLRSVDTNKQ